MREARLRSSFLIQIKCPDKACEAEDCPKCVTICKQPHCVTHCQVLFNNQFNVRLPNPNAKPSVRTPAAIGNVINLNVLNLNANLSVKTQIASPRWPAAPAKAVFREPALLSSSKKPNRILHVVNADNDEINYDDFKFHNLFT